MNSVSCFRGDLGDGIITILVPLTKNKVCPFKKILFLFFKRCDPSR